MALRNLQAAKVAMSKESRRLTAGRKTNTDRLHNESKVRPPTCLPPQKLSQRRQRLHTDARARGHGRCEPRSWLGNRKTRNAGRLKQTARYPSAPIL